jgi:hypothetical protein
LAVGLLLTVGGGDELASALLLTKTLLALQVVQLRHGSLSRPDVLRRRTVRGLEDVRLRLRLGVVAGSCSHLSSALANLTTATSRREAVSDVVLAKRRLQLALDGGDRLGLLQDAPTSRLELCSLGVGVRAESDGGTEAFERRAQLVGDRHAGAGGAACATDVALELGAAVVAAGGHEHLRVDAGLLDVAADAAAAVGEHLGRVHRRGDGGHVDEMLADGDDAAALGEGRTSEDAGVVDDAVEAAEAVDEAGDDALAVVGDGSRPEQIAGRHRSRPHGGRQLSSDWRRQILRVG